MQLIRSLFLFAIVTAQTVAFRTTRPLLHKFPRVLNMVTVNDPAPTSVAVDLIEVGADGKFSATPCDDFGALLKSHKKAVLFAVPGAFTPTCSEKHLPGFIEKANQLKEKGVEAIYCLTVNDKFVTKSWAQATAGADGSGIKFIADGNADYTKALDLVKDATGGRMGLRCTRFAAVLENGVFKNVEVDAAGFEKSSAESILSLL